MTRGDRIGNNGPVESILIGAARRLADKVDDVVAVGSRGGVGIAGVGEIGVIDGDIRFIGADEFEYFFLNFKMLRVERFFEAPYKAIGEDIESLVGRFGDRRSRVGNFEKFVVDGREEILVGVGVGDELVFHDEIGNKLEWSDAALGVDERDEEVGVAERHTDTFDSEALGINLRLRKGEVDEKEYMHVDLLKVIAAQIGKLD